MMSEACIAGENPQLDLVQSYALHQCCPGLVYVPGQEEPDPCPCPCHGMHAGRASRQARPVRVVLTLAAAAAFLVFFVAWLR